MSSRLESAADEDAVQSQLEREKAFGHDGSDDGALKRPRRLRRDIFFNCSHSGV